MKNRYLILLLIFILLLTGCKAKPPNNVGQQFYEDMIFCINDLKEIIPTFTVNEYGTTLYDLVKTEGYKKYSEYDENIEELNIKEQKILKSLKEIYFYTSLYYDFWISYQEEDDTSKEKVENYLYDFTELMEIKFSIKDIIL